MPAHAVVVSIVFTLEGLHCVSYTLESPIELQTLQLPMNDLAYMNGTRPP